MSVLPEIAGRDEFAVLVIRTCFDDGAAWRTVVAEVSRPWGTDGEFEARVHLVDDPVWAGAAPDAVLAAVTRDEELSVVFVADEVTMRSPHWALLALTTSAEDEVLDPEYYQELAGSPSVREFRTTPAATHDMHANLAVGNLVFEEYTREALSDPEGVLRPL